MNIFLGNLKKFKSISFDLTHFLFIHSIINNVYKVFLILNLYAVFENICYYLWSIVIYKSEIYIIAYSS